MIRHTVTFKLEHAPGSAAERDFLKAASELAAISTVSAFKILRQTSALSGFDFGISMDFASAEDYQFYVDHPDHAKFVQTRWIPEVSQFLELDYVTYEEDEIGISLATPG